MEDDNSWLGGSGTCSVCRSADKEWTGVCNTLIKSRERQLHALSSLPSVFFCNLLLKLFEYLAKAQKTYRNFHHLPHLNIILCTYFSTLHFIFHYGKHVEIISQWSSNNCLTETQLLCYHLLCYLEEHNFSECPLQKRKKITVRMWTSYRQHTVII